MPMSKAFFNHQIALTLTLSLGIALSVVATLFVSRWELSHQQMRFQRQIENLSTALQRSLNRYTDMLAFLGDYYGMQQRPVDRLLFANFVARSLQTHSGIQALEWAPFVQHRQRLAYEQKIQLEGFLGFKITELGGEGHLIRAADRPDYIPVTYIEPFTGNESALGYDLNSDVVRATAIAQARNTGQITATGRIRLVQEQRDQFSFLVFLPIYQNRQAVSRQFTGVLLGVFRVSDVVEESLQDLQYAIDFSIEDRSADPPEQFLGRYDAIRKQVITEQHSPQLLALEHSLCPSAESCIQTLTVGQRQWQIRFSPSVNYVVETQFSAIATFISGLLLTIGLAVFLDHLNRELEQTKSLAELRFRFFSMASHELRTPLSTILLSSENLQINFDNLTEEQKRNNIQRIYLTAKRMSQQISDLLLLTRLEVRQLDFHPELLILEPFCKQLIDEMQMGIPQPIKFTPSHPSTQAFLDKKLLQSLLTNLLSNAAKYSSRDTPILFNLRCDTQTATFEICDRGIGIPTPDQPQICQPFYRGSNIGEITGTGLGLTLVKTCVELHQGELQIESAVGTGTTITVKLPLEPRV